MPRFRPETKIAIDAVERALDQVPARVGADELTLKGTRDVVTATDVAVEDAIRTLVDDALNLPVVGEERGGEMPDGSSYWLVDPICGTRNFASDIPLFCVNLVLVEDAGVTVAVVGDPSSGEIQVAEAGRGAWALKNGSRRRLRTSPESETIVIEDGHATGARREQAARFVAAAIRSNQWDIRALSTTLSLGYVAAGRVAAYLERVDAAERGEHRGRLPPFLRRYVCLAGALERACQLQLQTQGVVSKPQLILPRYCSC